MLEFLKAVLFGIVEGITEWLPISSTGHMILLNEFVKLDVSPEFWEMFLVVIQLGAIVAVVLLFWKKIFPVLTCALVWMCKSPTPETAWSSPIKNYKNRTKGDAS